MGREQGRLSAAEHLGPPSTHTRPRRTLRGASASRRGWILRAAVARGKPVTAGGGRPACGQIPDPDTVGPRPTQRRNVRCHLHLKSPKTQLNPQTRDVFPNPRVFTTFNASLTPWFTGTRDVSASLSVGAGCPPASASVLHPGRPAWSGPGPLGRTHGDPGTCVCGEKGAGTGVCGRHAVPPRGVLLPHGSPEPGELIYVNTVVS